MSNRLKILTEILNEFKIRLEDYKQIQETKPSDLNGMFIESYKKSILSLENKIKELLLRKENNNEI